MFIESFLIFSTMTFMSSGFDRSHLILFSIKLFVDDNSSIFSFLATKTKLKFFDKTSTIALPIAPIAVIRAFFHNLSP